MRVVAGSARGRVLRSPDGEATRPTSDRVREAVFNALFSRVDLVDARVADLFAGSGALGIEALSRGAGAVWFVESDRHAVEVIEDNLDLLGFRDRATVLRSPVASALDSLPPALDVVLVDPPYTFDDWPDLLQRVEPVLGEGAIVVIESDRAVEIPAGWEKMRERAYGGTVITFTAPPAGQQHGPEGRSSAADHPDATGADA